MWNLIAHYKSVFFLGQLLYIYRYITIYFYSIYRIQVQHVHDFSRHHIVNVAQSEYPTLIYPRTLLPILHYYENYSFIAFNNKQNKNNNKIKVASSVF